MLVACAGLAGHARLVQAQIPFGQSALFELSGTVHLPDIDSATRQHLTRIEALIANRQWDEAIDTLQQVMENQSDHVVAVDSRLYLSVSDYCQLKISQLPDEALTAYRGRVDPLAQRWFEQGTRSHDPQVLINLLDQMFCSSWGDDALMALGEMALERGEYALAHDYWYRLVESPPLTVTRADFDKLLAANDLNDEQRKLLQDNYQAIAERDDKYFGLRLRAAENNWTDAELIPLARLFREHALSAPWLVYPGTDLPLAEIRARLVLLEIMQKSDAAAPAYQEFVRQYGHAEGRLAGRVQPLAEALATVREQSTHWPVAKSSHDWTTFAGNTDRMLVSDKALQIRKWAWKIPLAKAASFDGFAARSAEERYDLSSYFPVVAGRVVFVASATEICAYNLDTGVPAWGSPAIFQDHESSQAMNMGRAPVGTPRYTLTVYDNKLFARMGPAATSISPQSQRSQTHQSYLVCMDLERQGSLLWDTRQIEPLEERWSYDGVPVSDGNNVYVAMRRSEVHPKAFVACLDAQTGRMRWRREVCSAETLAQGTNDEITHNLLTLHGGTLYFNTNLGAIAALSTHDGRVRWMRRYARAEGKIPRENWPVHFYRDLTPCLYDRGIIYAAPSDSRHVMAINATTGELLWQTLDTSDVYFVHLLGVAQGKLIASGKNIGWIETSSGKIAKTWPPVTRPHSRAGYGRGVLSGDRVYWPALDPLAGQRLYVLDQRTGEQVAQPIELTQLRKSAAGNLLVAGDHLLVVSPDSIYAFPMVDADTPELQPESPPAPEAPKP